MIVDGTQARTAGAPILHEGCPDNEAYYHEAGDKPAVEAAFASAHHVTRFTTAINRITANTMEPRGCIGDYDQRFDRFTLYGQIQLPHMVRNTLAANVFGVPETAMSVVSPDVGGSFGMKQGHAPENHACLWAARKLGRQFTGCPSVARAISPIIMIVINTPRQNSPSAKTVNFSR